MTPLRKCLWSFIAIVCSAQLAVAEAPVGQVRFPYDQIRVPVWDLTSNVEGYTFTQDIVSDGQVIPLITGFALNHDSKGKLSGSGSTLVQIGTNFVAAEYTVSGRVTRGKSDTSALITVKMNGQGLVAGVDTTFNIKLSYKLVPNPIDQKLVGTVSGKASFSQLGSGKIKSNVSSPLPAGVTGQWELWLNVLPLSSLNGSGYVEILNPTLSEQRQLQGSVSGGYNEKQGVSKVTLNGDSLNRGTKLKVTFTTANGLSRLQGMKGKVLGQNVTIN